MTIIYTTILPNVETCQKVHNMEDVTLLTVNAYLLTLKGEEGGYADRKRGISTLSLLVILHVILHAYRHLQTRFGENNVFKKMYSKTHPDCVNNNKIPGNTFTKTNARANYLATKYVRSVYKSYLI